MKRERKEYKVNPSLAHLVESIFEVKRTIRTEKTKKELLMVKPRQFILMKELRNLKIDMNMSSLQGRY